MIGDILLVRNGGCLFKRIRDLTNSEFDHAAIFIAEDKVIESIPVGVVIRDFSKVYKNSNYKICRLTDQSRVPKMVEYCLSNLGKHYDFLQLLSLYILVGLRVKRTVEPIEFKNAFICTELISQAAEFAGFRFQDGVANDRITPQDIYSSNKVVVL